MSKVEFTAGNWNPFESMRVPNSTGSLMAGHAGMSKRHLKNAQALIDQHHKNVMEHLEASYGHETKFQSHLSGLREQEATGAHSRGMEFASFVHKGAEGGTGVNINLPTGASASYTRKKSAPKTPKQKPATASAFPPVKLSEEPQSEPTPSEPSAAKPAGPSVGRDARGRAVSLKNQSAAKPSAKKTAPEKVGPSVTRDAKGRARSLKKP